MKILISPDPHKKYFSSSSSSLYPLLIFLFFFSFLSFKFLDFLVGVVWYLAVVLIYIALISDNSHHLFMCFVAISVVLQVNDYSYTLNI
jgi:hypothetical protein